jgi:uncharacterized protein
MPQPRAHGPRAHGPVALADPACYRAGAVVTVSILDQLLASVTADAPLRAVERGERACAVWSRGLGLASVCPAPTPAAPAPALSVVDAAGSARSLAALSRAADPDQSVLGLAALNSLLDPAGLPLEDGRAQDLLASFADRRICMVGHFPFVERLRRQVRRLVVLELCPGEGDLPAAAAPDEIPAADVVAITGTTLVNHTLDGLLRLATGKTILLLGPSTPLHPALFDHGVDILCGSLAVDPPAVLASVREGLSFRECAGLRRVILRREALATRPR